MRRALFAAAAVAVAAVFWLRPTTPLGPQAGAPPATVACRWQQGQTFAFDVAVDSRLTFDESALVPGAPAGGEGRSENAVAGGRLDARVLSVAPDGVATVAARLPDWTTNAIGAGAVPSIDDDMRRPYLLRVDARCRVVGTARPHDASVIAYRRVLGVVDRLDFALPAPGADDTAPYATRQLDDFGPYTIENRWRPGDGRGTLERRRTAYDTPPSDDALPVRIRIRAAGGSVDLGDSTWFSAIADEEDVDVVSDGRVPLRSRSTTAITARDVDSHAFDDVAIDVTRFTWGRPTDDELQAAHDALRGNEYAGLPASDAMTRFTTMRDAKAPGAWHDAQRMLRDWMRGNPDGVRELSQSLRAGRYGRSDQADVVLAMAKSRSPVARRELTGMAADDAAASDLRVQAASACGDLTEPTPETVETLERLAFQPRTGTYDDVLPSTALMSLGTIVDTAPGTPAAAQARAILQRTLGTDLTVEALYAASNSGDPSFEAAAVDYAASDVAEERAAAAHAVRKMLPSAVTDDMLNALMRDDTHPDVVKQVAEARRQQLQTFGGSLSAGELTLYATKLASAPEGVRWELVRTIGQSAPLQPAATTVLVDWYRQEPVASLRVLIGQYVPARALRN